jgi:hypothetical protein
VLPYQLPPAGTKRTAVAARFDPVPGADGFSNPPLRIRVYAVRARGRDAFGDAAGGRACGVHPAPRRRAAA